MADVSKHLVRWQNAGLLSRAQAEAIYHYEKNHPGQSWVTLAAASTGIFGIIAGLILLAATYWPTLGSVPKIGFGLVGYAVLAGLWQARQRHQLLWLPPEALLIGTLLYNVAVALLLDDVLGLALALPQLGLLWSLLSLPVMPLTRQPLLPVCWLAVLLLSSVAALGQARWLGPSDTVYLLLSLPPLLLGLAFTFLLRPSLRIMARACYQLAFVGFAVALTGIQMGHALFEPIRSLLLLLPAFCSLALVQERRLPAPARLSLLLAMLGYNVLVLLLPLQLSDHALYGPLIRLLAFTTTGALAAAAIFQRHHKIYGLCLLAMVLQLVWAFTDFLGDWLYSAGGLLLSGSLLLLMVYGWHRYRHQLMHWLLHPR